MCFTVSDVGEGVDLPSIVGGLDAPAHAPHITYFKNKTKQKCVCMLNAVSRMLISTLMELTVYHLVPTDWKRFPVDHVGLGWLVTVTT